MVTESQEEYLASIPDKVVEVGPFDPKAQEAGLFMTQKLKNLFPELPVVFIGSAALGVSGQNDLDIQVLSTPSEYSLHRVRLEELFGAPTRITNSIKWDFKYDGFRVDLYLTDRDSPKLKEQIRVFEILSKDDQLRAEYDALKKPFGQQDYKIYMHKKYEFFNRILGLG